MLEFLFLLLLSVVPSTPTAVIDVKLSSQGACPVLSCATPLTLPRDLWSERSPEAWTGDFNVLSCVGDGGVLTGPEGWERGRPDALVLFFVL